MYKRIRETSKGEEAEKAGDCKGETKGSELTGAGRPETEGRTEGRRSPRKTEAR